MKVLLACDGSACSDRAARHVAGSLRRHVPALAVTLLHVDAPMPEAVAHAIGSQRAGEIHRENGAAALRPARRRLQRAHVPFEERQAIGHAAAQICHVASTGRFDLIVMGSHGRTAVASTLLGSVTLRVLSECKVPVLVVR